MTAAKLPRTDRWLVHPQALFEHLQGLAAEDDALMRHRFRSGHVEPVGPALLAERAMALLAEEWAMVRIVVDWADAEPELAASLDELARRCAPDALARLRLHQAVGGTDTPPSTLDAPDSAVLAHWVSSGARGAPQLGGAGLSQEWMQAYREAFDVWRRSVVASHGHDVFDAVFDIDRADAGPRASGSADLVRFVAWQALAANDERTRAAGTSPRDVPRRVAAGGGYRAGDTSTPPGALLATLKGEVDGQSVHVSLRAPARAGLPVLAEIRMASAARAKAHLLRLRVLRHDAGELVATSSELVWVKPVERQAFALARTEFEQGRDTLLALLQAPGSASLLRVELQVARTFRLQRLSTVRGGGTPPDARWRYDDESLRIEMDAHRDGAADRLQVAIRATCLGAAPGRAIVHMADGTIVELAGDGGEMWRGSLPWTSESEPGAFVDVAFIPQA